MLTQKGACLPACTPFYAFYCNILFCNTGFILYYLQRRCKGKLFLLFVYIATFSLKVFFVQINFNKMLLNKSKLQGFPLPFSYICPIIFLSTYKGVSRLNTEISMNILFYDMGSYTYQDTLYYLEAAWSYLQNVILPLPQ